jgi:hypothetical protein
MTECRKKESKNGSQWTDKCAFLRSFLDQRKEDMLSLASWIKMRARERTNKARGRGKKKEEEED